VSTIRNGLVHRLFLGGLATMLFVGSAYDALNGKGVSHWVTAVGFAMLGVAWFMQPLVLNKGLAEAVRESSRLALGPRQLRTWLGALGLAILVLGLVLRLSRAA
jgi:hypothetical protein